MSVCIFGPGMHCCILIFLDFFAVFRVGQFADRLLQSQKYPFLGRKKSKMNNLWYYLTFPYSFRKEMCIENYLSLTLPPPTPIKSGFQMWPIISLYWHTELETHQYLNNIPKRMVCGKYYIWLLCLPLKCWFRMDWLIQNVKVRMKFWVALSSELYI